MGAGGVYLRTHSAVAIGSRRPKLLSGPSVHCLFDVCVVVATLQYVLFLHMYLRVVSPCVYIESPTTASACAVVFFCLFLQMVFEQLSRYISGASHSNFLLLRVSCFSQMFFFFGQEACRTT